MGAGAFGYFLGAQKVRRRRNPWTAKKALISFTPSRYDPQIIGHKEWWFPFQGTKDLILDGTRRRNYGPHNNIFICSIKMVIGGWRGIISNNNERANPVVKGRFECNLKSKMIDDLAIHGFRRRVTFCANRK
jgi:hypothetical protein